MEVAAAVVGSVLTCVLNQLGVKSLSEEIQTLRNRKRDLIARVNEVEETLRIAEVEQGRTRTSEAINWLTNAKNVINKADDVDKEANVGRRCLSGVLPNCCSPSCCSRLKLLKQILEFTEEMVGLLDEASRIPKESWTFLGMEMQTTRLIGSTADKNFKMVWEYIVGDEFEKIGVYGMGGVGKTTIMKKISNQLVQERRHFENVLWVTVSRDVDAQKLQQQIAKAVDLDISARQDEASRSSSLFSALQRKGKFVLFLDDIWETFDLHELGVPEPSEDNKCKIVLTTRSLEVCHRMQCHKDLKVEPLSVDEAWELFMDNVDEKLVPEVEEIAKEIVAECCGLPLAIITIGRSMRRKDVEEWRVALSDLKESTSLNMDLEEKVIQRLKFSYDQLRENHQKCFLYCALYPEDYQIDTSKLIEYWVMEGLVKGSSKENEMDRGYVILKTLKRCCMLEEVSEDRDCVKMHDLIRDMALYITKTKPKFMVRTGVSSTEIPREDDWSKDLERVSFMRSCIEDISIIPKCPKLSTLILSQDWQGGLKHVASDFFMHMNSLAVLDLSGTLIESLPNSVSDLVNLRGLLLLDCRKLVRVPSLSKLQSLRVLKLTGSAIEELPHGMEMLVNLRSLDLSDNSKLVRVSSLSKFQSLRVLKLTSSAIEELPQGMEMLVNLRSLDLSGNSKLKEMIPSGLISKFSLLQELNLEESNAVYWLERGGDFVLTHLENLEVKFHELSDFIAYGKFGNFERLKKYFITMEECKIYGSSPYIRLERHLYLSNWEGIPCNALSLPKRIQFLGVYKFNQITRLSELPLNDSQQDDLRELHIYFCNSIEFIVPEDEEGIFLQRIESMTIFGCHRLSKIYEKVPAHGAFPCLKILQIKFCDNIKFLFSSRLLQQLLNLEEIQVQNCTQLEELIIVEEEEEPVEDTGTGIDYTVALPRLKRLDFRNLPKLKSIWKGVMVCDSLQTVDVRKCPELKRLPLFNREHQSAPPSLKEIKGRREWWDSLEWGDYQCPEHLFKEWN